MMTLTQEQIQKVESYLDGKNLTYVDIRIEVLDHMISDIENAMCDENKVFQDAFKSSIVNWRPQLQGTNSLLLGIQHIRPKILIDKSKSIFLKWYLFIMVGLLMTLLLNTSLDSIIHPDIHYTINMIMLSCVIILTILLITWYVKMINTRIKSSYLFIFEKQVFSTLILLNAIIIYNILSSIEGLEITTVTLTALFFTTAFFGFRLYKKHKDLAQNYTLL